MHEKSPWFKLPAEHLKELFPEFSDRESQVCILYFGGLDSREIAKMLFISHKTVNAHIYNALSKLDLKSFHELRAAIILRLFASKF